MGILNLSPDSFSQDGINAKTPRDVQKVLRLALRLVREGADILDVGGESSRPGSHPIPTKEEIQRIIPAIKVLSQKIKIPISVDTYKPVVAQHALEAGAAIVNNIMGTHCEKIFLQMISRYNAAVVLMHIRGTPRTMQQNIHYQNLKKEVRKELRRAVDQCLDAGIKPHQIIVDPGLGFGKTAAHNLELIRDLNDFASLDCPLLVGPSRKSFIGWILKNEVEQRLTGTIAAVCASILNGAHLVRVHDVGEVKEAALMIDAIMNVG